MDVVMYFCLWPADIKGKDWFGLVLSSSHSSCWLEGGEYAFTAALAVT